MVVVVVLAAVVLAAVGCWVAQQTYGLGITGMNNSNSWGLYIMAFMFFVGLSAGGLIVASSAHVFGIESFKRVSVPAVITSSTSRTFMPSASCVPPIMPPSPWSFFSLRSKV